MSKIKEEHLVFMTDDMYTPISYKGVSVSPPLYKGNGEHSVRDLEKICNQYKEYVSQQQIIKQNCMKHIVELKFGIKFESNDH